MRRPYAVDTPRELSIESVVVSDELGDDDVTAKYSFTPGAISTIRRSDPNAITLRSVCADTWIDRRRRNDRDVIVLSVSVLISLTLGGLTAAALAVAFCAAIGAARWCLERRLD